MSFPAYDLMAEALLCFIYKHGGDGHGVTPKETYEPLANFFGLSDRARTRPRPDGKPGLHWHNRVQWTRQRLINSGLLDGSTYGVWRLTLRGRRQAQRLIAKYQKLP